MKAIIIFLLIFTTLLLLGLSVLYAYKFGSRNRDKKEQSQSDLTSNNDKKNKPSSDKKDFLLRDQEEEKKVKKLKEEEEEIVDIEIKRHGGLDVAQDPKYDSVEKTPVKSNMKIVGVGKKLGFWTGFIMAQKMGYIMARIRAQHASKDGRDGFWVNLIKAQQASQGKDQSRGR